MATIVYLITPVAILMVLKQHINSKKSIIDITNKA